MPTITKLEDLEIWQSARKFAKDIATQLNSDLFRDEPGLKHQMKNASGSIMDNIAEGFGRTSKNEFVNHLTIARGSAEETKSQLYRCKDQLLIEEKNAGRLISELEMLIKRIAALINYLNKTPVKGVKFKDRQ